ncbi:MAG: SGNH/GDSL hydrolase family protein, partial [Candidatus Hydrogenedentes bacterium]|nr:SGNH/GDSL hydrolase family protein [Candidatus Hydrogenedentota bacterium]
MDKEGACSMRRMSLVFLMATVVAFTTAVAQEPEKLDPAKAAKVTDGILWYSVLDLGLEGKGWTDTKHPFDRMPAKAEGVVTDNVWNLSHHSAGMCARFVTDARVIHARWTVRNDNLDMPHMPATGVSGLDLYVRGPEGWGWVAQGRPKEKTNEAKLLEGMPEGPHEYLVYLPLYNGVESVEIGIPNAAYMAKATPRPAEKAKPVLVYGTSITHGGCAARPGMAYPAILGRWLDRPFINLGFSGSGRMELPMADLLGELDCAAYVLDCLPNLTAAEVSERVVPFVKRLRELRPETPILFVENIQYQAGWFLEGSKKSYEEKNAALTEAFTSLQKDGLQNLHYLSCSELLGHDHEATVDGTHPTDLGFYRMAEA